MVERGEQLYLKSALQKFFAKIISAKIEPLIVASGLAVRPASGLQGKFFYG